MSAYLQEFKSTKDIELEFQCKVPEGADILLAWYGYGDYSGSALVLYRLDGKLYEVNAYHCSCNGLDDQWFPEETTIAALKMREMYTCTLDTKYEYYRGENEAFTKFRSIVDSLSEEGVA